MGLRRRALAAMVAIMLQACVLPVARAQAAAGAVPPADDPAATETPSAALAAAAASPAKAAALKAAAAKVTAAKGLAAPGVAAEAADAGPPAPKDKGPPAAAAAAAAEEGDYAAPATDATAAWAAAAAGLSARWLANPWLVWGVGPMLGVNLGFFLTAALLELLLATRLLDSDLLVYPAGGDAPPRRRDAALAATQERIPFRKQLLTCLFIVAGPNVVANGVSLTLLMRLAGAALPAAWWPADALAAAWQLLAMAVVADFGLYWGHRVQHESKLLWQVHKVHHRIETPTPFSTMYIHGLDATLQGGLPMALAALLIRPAPAILYISFGLRVAENALNHSGLDSPLLDLVTLKSLPFRAAASHHDAHHKYCNHPKNAKNYGETFWVWDWMFGTINPRRGARQGPPPKRVD